MKFIPIVLIGAAIWLLMQALLMSLDAQRGLVKFNQEGVQWIIGSGFFICAALIVTLFIKKDE